MEWILHFDYESNEELVKSSKYKIISVLMAALFLFIFAHTLPCSFLPRHRSACRVSYLNISALAFIFSGCCGNVSARGATATINNISPHTLFRERHASLASAFARKMRPRCHAAISWNPSKNWSKARNTPDTFGLHKRVWLLSKSAKEIEKKSRRSP